MKLLTETQKKNIAEKYPLYSQDGKYGEAVCVAKFFLANWTWYIIEGQPDGDDFLMFGIVLNGFGDEYGYVSLKEVESVKVRGVLEVERDKYFKETELKNIDDPDLRKFLAKFEEKVVSE
ncbi:MAG: DUF2958 domain-containing protein [Prevotellaceae bacterium]|nr:DUF2958 domain-containing protein [Prevotellaceae bacterium]